MPGLVSGVVLAAGSARRMNGNKLLLDIGGRPLLCMVAEEAAAASLSEVLVIVSETNERSIREALHDLPVKIVAKPRAAEGMGTSLAHSARSVSPDAAALLSMQGDQPLVDRTMLRRRKSGPDGI